MTVVWKVSSSQKTRQATVTFALVDNADENGSQKTKRTSSGDVGRKWTRQLAPRCVRRANNELEVPRDGVNKNFRIQLGKGRRLEDAGRRSLETIPKTIGLRLRKASEQNSAGGVAKKGNGQGRRRVSNYGPWDRDVRVSSIAACSAIYKKSCSLLYYSTSHWLDGHVNGVEASDVIERTRATGYVALIIGGHRKVIAPSCISQSIVTTQVVGLTRATLFTITLRRIA